MFSKHLALALAIALPACGSKTKVKDGPVLSFLFQVDNSLRTLVRCAIDGDSIKCDETTRAPLPAISSFQVYSSIGDWRKFQFLQGPNGCFEGKPEDGSATLDQLDKLEEIGKSDTCKPVIRLVDSAGNIEEEWGLGATSRPQPAYFSGYLEPMQTYSLQMRNLEGGDCKLPIRLKGEQSYSDASINEVQYTFGSGFSLHYNAQIHSQNATIRKGQPFTYSWAPALDTAPLIAAGMDDDAVMDLLQRNIEDGIILKATDRYGHGLFCKAPDAPLGSISISGELMGRLERSAGFSLTRYKLLREKVSPTVELVWVLSIGEYIDRTDVGGVTAGLRVEIRDE